MITTCQWRANVLQTVSNLTLVTTHGVDSVIRSLLIQHRYNSCRWGRDSNPGHVRLLSFSLILCVTCLCLPLACPPSSVTTTLYLPFTSLQTDVHSLVSCCVGLSALAPEVPSPLQSPFLPHQVLDQCPWPILNPIK